jgi:N-acetylneuraminic acid mutarotase
MKKILLVLSLTALCAQAQPDTWKEGAKMSVARSEMRGAWIDSLFYVPAGVGANDADVNTLEAYNPLTNKWKTLASLPVGLNHHAVAAYDGKLYVIKNKTYRYDPATNSWTDTLATAHFLREDATALTLGKYIWLIGGQKTGNIERYSPESNKWTVLASMRQDRGHVQAVVYNGKIWALCGRDGNKADATHIGPLNSVEIYDTASNTWTDGPSTHDLRSGHAAAVIDEKIIISAGEIYDTLPGSTGPKIVKTTEFYDPLSNKWYYGADMPSAAHGTASFAYQGRMYVVGGSTQSFAAVNLDKVQIYTPPQAATLLRAPEKKPSPAAPKTTGFWRGRNLLGRIFGFRNF